MHFVYVMTFSNRRGRLGRREHFPFLTLDFCITRYMRRFQRKECGFVLHRSGAISGLCFSSLGSLASSRTFTLLRWRRRALSWFSSSEHRRHAQDLFHREHRRYVSANAARHIFVLRDCLDPQVDFAMRLAFF